jgi:hypothetical protein
MDLDRDVVARVLRVAGEREPLDARQVDHAADLRRPARERLADGQRRIRAELRDGDQDRRLAQGLDVDLRPEGLATQDEGPDADDGAVDGRVDIGPGRGADVERAGGGPAAAAELVVGDPAPAAAEDAMEDAREEPLVRLPPERVERERVVACSVVPDRGHVPRVDRKLDPQRAVDGDHERARRACRQQARGARRRAQADSRAAAGPERRDGDHDQDGEAEEKKDRPPPGPPHGARRTPRTGAPVGARLGHPGHRSVGRFG